MEPVDAAHIFSKLFSLVDGVCDRQNISSIKRKAKYKGLISCGIRTLICDAISLKAGNNCILGCQLGLQSAYLLVSHTQKIDGFSTNAAMNLRRESLKA